MNAILIAEDEKRIAAFVEKGLRAAGLTPTVVDDGRTAFDYAMTGAFDLVVLDIGLPLMDGFSVLRRLRESRNDIPVIILTARDSITDTVAGLEGGADDYMPKPFRFEELLARIRLRLRDSQEGGRGQRRNSRKASCEAARANRRYERRSLSSTRGGRHAMTVVGCLKLVRQTTRSSMPSRMISRSASG